MLTPPHDLSARSCCTTCEAMGAAYYIKLKAYPCRGVPRRWHSQGG